jgi:hypothetical protein
LVLPQTTSFSLDSFSVGIPNADVLTGKSPCDDIDFPSPRFSLKCAHIIPDWESWQDTIPLTLQEHLSAERFNLDSTDAGMSEKQSAEDSAPCSGK